MVLVALFGLACAVGGPAASAFEDKKEVKKGERKELSSETKGAKLLLAAAEMARFGREHKSPEALLAAARAIASVSVQPMDPKNVKDADKEGSDTDKESNENVLKAAQREAMALVDEAVKIAKDKDAIEKIAEPLRTRITAMKRGAVRGPVVRYGTVGRGDRQDTFTIRFKGGEPAVIIVNNQSNRGDIDLVVENDEGRVVAQDRRSDDDATVTFFPRGTHTYYVKVKFFAGRGALRYKLTTN